MQYGLYYMDDKIQQNIIYVEYKQYVGMKSKFIPNFPDLRVKAVQLANRIEIILYEFIDLLYRK